MSSDINLCVHVHVQFMYSICVFVRILLGVTKSIYFTHFFLYKRAHVQYMYLCIVQYMCMCICALMRTFQVGDDKKTQPLYSQTFSGGDIHVYMYMLYTQRIIYTCTYTILTYRVLCGWGPSPKSHLRQLIYSTYSVLIA